MRDINEQLQALYAGKWGDIGDALRESVEGDPISPTNPLLLHVGNEEAWRSAHLRVMVFGQETNDWKGEYHPDKTIAYLCGLYDGFFNKGACWSYGGQFWNGVNRLKSMLAEKFPGKQIQYLWNNIVKIGKAEAKGRPPAYIYEQERTFFHVIPEEVNILQPNVFLFFTGPNYDDAIHNNFEATGYTPVPPFEARQLAKISIPAIDSAFRTYHPNYLWRNDIDSYLGAIVQAVTI
jgi:hypothetical protein